MKNLSPSIIHTTVFAATAEGGNPCPVVCDADNLSSETMQAMTAKFGVETAFVLTPDMPEAELRLRYFVPRHEMEMCVHATVGTTYALVQQGQITQSPVKIQTPLGIISVSWENDPEQGLSVMVEQFSPKFSDNNPDAAEVADLLGIPITNIDESISPIQSVSTSRPKLMIPLTDFHTLDELKPDFERLWEICDTYQTTGFYPFTTQTRHEDLQVEARQFPKRAGYNEDPATGVAACALGAYLTEHEVLSPKSQGWHHIQIGQGYAMQRPSIMGAELLVENSIITKTRIKGRARIVDGARKP